MGEKKNNAYQKLYNLAPEYRLAVNKKPNKLVNNKKNNTSTLKTKKESCYDKIDFTWSIPKNDMFGKFSFTSRSEKSINIHKIIIYTKDNQLVLEDEVSINLKPFGIGSTLEIQSFILII